MSELEDFRAEKDAFFRDDPRSPLTPGQRNGFGGLAYFREEPGLAIHAELESQGVDRDEAIEMQTTTGGFQVYRRAGIVRFEADGEPAVVTLYASEDMHELFVPFRDATSGKETYGAGRYLEVESPGTQGAVPVHGLIEDAHDLLARHHGARSYRLRRRSCRRGTRRIGRDGPIEQRSRREQERKCSQQ